MLNPLLRYGWMPLLAALALPAQAQSGFYNEPAEAEYLANPENAKNSDFDPRLEAYVKAPWYQERTTVISSEWVVAGKNDPMVRSSPQFREKAAEYQKLYDAAVQRIGPKEAHPSNYYTGAERTAIYAAKSAMDRTYHNLRNNIPELRETIERDRAETTNLDRAVALLQMEHITQKNYYPDLIRELHSKGRYSKGRQIVQRLILSAGTQIRELQSKKILVRISREAALDGDHQTLEAILHTFQDPGRDLKPVMKEVAEIALNYWSNDELNITHDTVAAALDHFRLSELKGRWEKKLHSKMANAMNNYLPTGAGYVIDNFNTFQNVMNYSLRMFAVSDPVLFEYLMVRVYLPYPFRLAQQIKAYIQAEPGRAKAIRAPEFLKEFHKHADFAEFRKLDLASNDPLCGVELHVQ